MLPAEEQQQLQREQAKLRETYGELPPARDKARLAAQDARAVVNALREPLVAKRRELEDLEGRFNDSVGKAEAAEVEQERLTLEIEQMEVRDEQITERLRELNRIMREVRETEPESRPAPTAVESPLLAAAQRFGVFSVRDLAVVLKQSPKAVKVAVEAYVREGRIRDLNRKVMGQPVYEHLGAAKERKQEEAESFRLVRDFAVVQKEPFSPSAVSEATEVEGPELDQAILALVDRGTIREVGFGDLPLYEYVAPTEMGRAAERDADRRRDLARQAPTETGATPVAGTGRKLAISNADVRALVAQIEQAGGKVTTGARGGHYIVSAPGSRRQVPISSTPASRRSVQNDRSRVRRELGLNI